MSLLSSLIDAAEAKAAGRAFTPTTIDPAPASEAGTTAAMVFVTIDPESEIEAAALVTAMYEAGFGVTGYREWQGTDGAGFQGNLTRTVPNKKRPVKVGWFHQDGRGGCVEFHYERNGNGDMARRAVTKIIEATPDYTYAASPKHHTPEFTVKTDLDLLLSMFSAEHHARTKVRRSCRKHLVFTTADCEPGTYSWYKAPDSPALRTKVLAEHGPVVVFLNDLPWAK